MKYSFRVQNYQRVGRWILLIIVPFIAAFFALDLANTNLAIPFTYGMHDDVWQYVLTKALRDNGWVLTNNYLGAPSIANWHYHSAAQTSALHSVLMKLLLLFSDDTILVQQLYYIINFPMITMTTYLVARQLGTTHLPAFCAGLIFAFTTYRFSSSFLAFLANYFMIPLSILPVVWLLSGAFDAGRAVEVEHGYRILKSRKGKIIASIVILAIAAASDGYYAFFTLLLVSFAAVAILVRSPVARRNSLVLALIFGGLIMGTQLLLMIPLQMYKASHQQEFLVDGLPDPTLDKSPFEAEVYNSSLKLLIAPIISHRVPVLAELGQWIIETSDAARLYKVVQPAVSLGTLGSLALGGVFLTMLSPSRRGVYRNKDGLVNEAGQVDLVGSSLIGLSAFAFLCSIYGGVGTLVALIYPTIRAYDRMPLYLLAILLLILSRAASAGLLKLPKSAVNFAAWAMCLGTVLVLFDQVPVWSRDRDARIERRYLAEQSVVKAIEASAPGGMIYQFPFSQYLTDNKYYGWGAFSQLRMYLHSRSLRWSNGASKNSPVDLWHMKLAELPLDQLLKEIWSAGFAGILVDQRVMPEADYLETKATLTRLIGEPDIEDSVAQLSYWTLPDPGFQLIYGPDFGRPAILQVGTTGLLDTRAVPSWLNAVGLEAELNSMRSSGQISLEITDDSDLLLSSQGGGPAAAQMSPSTLLGSVDCTVSNLVLSDGGQSFSITVQNASPFDWIMNRGANPITVGVHILEEDGSVRNYDSGYRLDGYIPVLAGGAAQIELPIADFALGGMVEGDRGQLQFELLQEGVAWFSLNPGNRSCTVPFTRGE